MEMKWHPIVNGDLSEVPRDEEFLFSIFDERGKETYGATGWIIENEGELELRGVDPWGLNSNETKKVKAWMEFPEPYKQGGCDMCKHLKQWTDEFGDRLSQCELWPEYKPEDCPLNR